MRSGKTFTAVVGVVLIGVMALVQTVMAQAKEEPTPRPIGGLSFADDLEVTVVSVDVYVRDKKGLAVEGLTKDDFVIYQDDVKMPISNFGVLTEDVFTHSFAAPVDQVLAGGPTPTPSPDAPEIRPIYMVLYVDNENLGPLDRNRVLRQVRDFVKDNLRPPTQMMVVSYQKSLKVEQAFTGDSLAILNSLRELRMHTGGRTERDSTRREITERLREEKDRIREDRSTGNNQHLRTGAYREIIAFAEEESNRLVFSVNAIRQVISMLSGLEGRKSIVYISDGLPMVPGLELFYEYSSLFHDSSILTKSAQFNRSRTFQSLTAAANGQDVVFYTIEAKGLAVSAGISAENRYNVDPLASSLGTSNYQDSLRFMADSTGGLAIINSNDVSRGLERIELDLHTYYSLGYTVNSSGSDKVHRIKVELADESANYKYRYRRRFVEKSRESRVQDTVMTALMVEVEDNPMQVALDIGRSTPSTSEHWTVPVHVSFPLRKVALVPDHKDYVGRVVLFVAARDEKGKQSDLQRQEHEVRIPAADYDEAQRKRFGLDVPLLMGEGSYWVAVGLMDQITRQASFYRVRISVP